MSIILCFYSHISTTFVSAKTKGLAQNLQRERERERERERVTPPKVLLTRAYYNINFPKFYHSCNIVFGNVAFFLLTKTIFTCLLSHNKCFYKP